MHRAQALLPSQAKRRWDIMRAPSAPTLKETMMHLARHEPGRNICVAALLIVALAGCAKPTRPIENADIYERSTHRLTQSPQAAAACIARNAETAGYSAMLQPLFGTAAVAVSIRDGGLTGTTLATISMLPEEKGSRATVTNPREGLRERKTLLDTLFARC